MAASKITGGCWPVIKILPPFTTHSNPPTIAASPPKRIRAEVAVTPLSYAFPYEHMISPAQSRRTSLRLIHPSAWKGYSRKFGCTILDNLEFRGHSSSSGLQPHRGAGHNILEACIKI